jgi:hypothetical protein
MTTRKKTKVGVVLSATAVGALGFASQANAWTLLIEQQSTTLTDVAICAATSASPGLVHLRGTSTLPKANAPDGFGLSSQRNVTESIFAETSMNTKIVEVAVDQTVTDQSATEWFMTGDGKAVLPPVILAGTVLYVRESSVTAKSLTVSNPSYGCPTNVAPGAPISVPVPAQMVDNKLTTVSHPVSDPVSVSIPAGSYSVEQGSLDDAHPFQEDQLAERWYAVFTGPSGVVGTTSTTPDLATADTSKVWASDNLDLTAPATSVTYHHAPGGDGPDSIYPNLLRLTLIKPVDPTTTTTPTTIPVTVATTVKPDIPKPPVTGEQVQSIVPVVVGPDQVVPTTTTTAVPTSTGVPTTVAPKVEIKGIQVEELPVPTTAPSIAPEIALTGSTTSATLFAGILLATFGSFVVTAFGRRRVKS